LPLWVVLFLLAFGAATVACFLAGLARARYQRAPIIATVAIIAGLVIVVAAAWTWGSRCPGCGEGADGRKLALVLAIYLGGLCTVVDIGAAWVGAWVSTIIWAEQPPLVQRSVFGRTLTVASLLVVLSLFVLLFSGF
jgi:ammonia channel protein AmtB